MGCRGRTDVEDCPEGGGGWGAWAEVGESGRRGISCHEMITMKIIFGG